MKKMLGLNSSDAVFIMLINVKMPTIVGILTFTSRINLVLSWVEFEKKFYNLGARGRRFDLRLLQSVGWDFKPCSRLYHIRKSVRTKSTSFPLANEDESPYDPSCLWDIKHEHTDSR